ncbi:hypothetical protein BH09PLA1_BH09PLA1_24120 [soil metagenome]
MNAPLRPIFLFALLAVALITQIGASCTNTDTSRRDDDLDTSVSIPRDARRVAEGSGELSYSARSDGRIYLYDINDRSVVDNRILRRDESYSVNPDANRILVDRKKVSDQDLKRKHNHRLYFLANDRRDRDRTDRDDRNTDSLPRNAKNVASGTGEVTYRVRDRGRIYIYDADNERILLSRDVRDGQTVLVDPGGDRVLIDGKKVYDNNLERKHTHRIYFEKD